MKRNLLLLLFRDVFVGISAAFGSASILQGFLLHEGLSEELIGIYVTFGSVVNFVVSLGLSGAAAATEKTVRASSVCYLLTGVISSAYLLPTLVPLGSSALFVCVMAITGLSSVTVALKTIFEYKLPCEVIDTEKYATYISFSGIITGLTGLGCSLGATALYRVAAFEKVSAAVFFVSSAAMVTAGLINRRLTVLHKPQPRPAEKNPMLGQLKGLFRNHDFRFLLLPNFIRGFGAAVVSLAAVLAVRMSGFTDAECSLITALISAGTLLSCVLYLPFVKLFGRAMSSFAGSVLFCLMVPAFLSKNKIVFSVFFVIAYIGYNITCNAIPDLIFCHISPQIISPFQTWRLALLTLGTTAGTALFGFLLPRVPPLVILLLGIPAYVFCGAAYYWRYRKA